MRTTEQKRADLLNLAKQRQTGRLPSHHCLANFHNGYYECNHVSPWTISACNVDAELMLIGQDWASSDVLEQAPNEDRREYGQDRSARTNINLRDFLECMNIRFGETYATNVFPFIKQGKKSGSIPFRDLVNCATTYACPQIEIVSPRMAICLGKLTFEAVRCAVGQPPIGWSEARLPSPHTRIGPVEIYGLPHPGQQGTNEAGGKDAVRRMWKLLAQRLENLREQT